MLKANMNSIMREIENKTKDENQPKWSFWRWKIQYQKDI